MTGPVEIVMRLVPVEKLSVFNIIKGPGRTEPAFGMVYFVRNVHDRFEPYTLHHGTNREQLKKYMEDGRLYVIDPDVLAIFDQANNS